MCVRESVCVHGDKNTKIVLWYVFVVGVWVWACVGVWVYACM